MTFVYETDSTLRLSYKTVQSVAWILSVFFTVTEDVTKKPKLQIVMSAFRNN